jgi:hypothetical protein
VAFLAEQAEGEQQSRKDGTGKKVAAINRHKRKPGAYSGSRVGVEGKHNR